MRQTRTFVAVPVTQAVRKRAGDLITRLETAGVRVKWVPPENMHITLKFLGEQTDDAVALICKSVLAAARDVLPFEIQCCGAGAFPSLQRPRTLWLGVREGEAALLELQERVEAELAQHHFRREQRAYHAHLTLGRTRSGGAALAQLGEVLAKASDFDAGRASVEEVLVLGSFLERRGPRYEVLARAPLGG